MLTRNVSLPLSADECLTIAEHKDRKPASNHFQATRPLQIPLQYRIFRWGQSTVTSVCFWRKVLSFRWVRSMAKSDSTQKLPHTHTLSVQNAAASKIFPAV
jgi:hypothetical protein